MLDFFKNIDCFDEDNNDNNQGYNGDPVHDSMLDYDTDIYEGTNITGLNPPRDANCDAGYEVYYVDYDDKARRCEARIQKLEGLIAAALASAAALDKNSAESSSAKEIQRYQRRAAKKRSDAERYQAKVEEVKDRYLRAKEEAEAVRTRTTAVICVLVSLFAILIAILF